MIKRLLIICGVIFLSFPLFAKAADLDVYFQQLPLFKDANLAPGNSVTRWVHVTNNTASSQQVALSLSNFSDDGGLSSQINITVTDEASSTLYSDTLQNLNQSGEANLSNVDPGQTAEYYVTAVFNSAAGNDYQGKTLGFDFNIGFEGSSSGTVQIYGGGGSSFGSSAIAPTATPTPPSAGAFPSGGLSFPGSVAGAQTPLGQIGEGVSTIRNLFASAGGSNNQPPGEVLGTATSAPASAAGVAALANEVCAKNSRWDFGYLVYILLLIIGLAFYKKLSFKNYSSGAAVAAVAALLWWWFEPCPRHLWLWPAAILAAVAVAVWLAWLLAKKSAPTSPTPPAS